MDTTRPISSTILRKLLLFLIFLTGLLSSQGQGVKPDAKVHQHWGSDMQLQKPRTEQPAENFGRQDASLPCKQHQRRKKTRGFARRLMIGSTAPTCTYNECRGCRFTCRAEQIPVDANDPINSAYHYRCVCHR